MPIQKNRQSGADNDVEWRRRTNQIMVVAFAIQVALATLLWFGITKPYIDGKNAEMRARYHTAPTTK